MTWQFAPETAKKSWEIGFSRMRFIPGYVLSRIFFKYSINSVNPIFNFFQKKKLKISKFSNFQVAIDSNQKIVGYCTIRVVNLNRIRASPFYAENGEIAAKLLAETVKIIPNFEKFDQLKFYYPSVNKEMERYEKINFILKINKIPKKKTDEKKFKKIFFVNI